MEGTPFGHYRLLKLVGRGGMGEVWRAHDTVSDRVVALKVLPPHLATDKHFQNRFRREARVAAGLYEPHIVPIHSYGELDGRLYVDMRLIDGQDLESLLGGGPLEPARAVKILDQVASALHAAHEVGLIHRDVKPSNILVTPSDFAYLIDFGIARAADSTGLTSTGSTIGTWAYMAPERFGTGEPDLRSDVYALACVLYQCLTGQLPFVGDSVEQQVAGHLSIAPPRPSVTNRTVPQAFDDVVAVGMAKNPSERYGTTTELAAAMTAAASQLAAGVPQQGLPYQPPTQAAHLGQHPREDATPWPPSNASSDSLSWARTEQRAHSDAEPAPFLPRERNPSLAVTARRPLLRHPAALAAALLAVVLLIGGAVVLITRHDTQQANMRSAGSQPAHLPRPAGPAFDGTFTATYGPKTSFGGAPQKSSSSTVTFVARSFCDRSGCVASATTVNRPEGVLTFAFDYANGRWTAVSIENDGECRGQKAVEHWRVYQLQPKPDGSFSGDFRAVYPSGGCNSKQPVTFTRTGGPDPSVQVTDPKVIAPFVRSPAQHFSGRYRRQIIYRDDGTRFDRDYVVDTYCLRTGQRCLSVANEAGQGAVYLNFAGDKWTGHLSSDGKCTRSGLAEHNETDWTVQVPQEPPDPIQQMSGEGTQTASGGCVKTFHFDITYTRTGD
ncbi:serine/threonine-protein kinase [Mycobacterium paraterrae]|uniref:non-specific serine/threonine protein kinase n=1 Tax=Mycobacterium paraterrae TaxID=577492 RepID=A0ABY3VTL9_9MYCO|nr:serine/threonine-protein kinase [Mycobacterium paraterrae]UMB69950.1 serine/threonine protein kinase [Mycobacterium paraterrae]